DVWYADGSIILVAEKTAFRVHSSILAANCEFFKIMLAIPQPAPGSDASMSTEMYEGCPVVRMQDSAVDLRHFLKSVYCFDYFRAAMKVKFPVVAAVLRLSNKYDARHLGQRAVNLLATAYPSTLLRWDDRDAQRLVPPFEGEHGAYIALAFETDIRVILPAIYLALSRRPLEDALHTLRTLAVDPSVHWDVAADFVHGREKLFQEELKHVLAFLDAAFARPGCQAWAQCASNLTDAARIALKKATGAESYHQWCGANASEVGRSLTLCATCCVTVENAIRKGRKMVWEQLPGL
ncbi:hypothetical protein BKA93DRAFT_713867, partial [Sparassis latifolia]